MHINNLTKGRTLTMKKMTKLAQKIPRLMKFNPGMLFDAINEKRKPMTATAAITAIANIVNMF